MSKQSTKTTRTFDEALGAKIDATVQHNDTPLSLRLGMALGSATNAAQLHAGVFTDSFRAARFATKRDNAAAREAVRAQLMAHYKL